MTIRVFHRHPFDSRAQYLRATTIGIAKASAKAFDATPEDWKTLRAVFAPKSKGQIFATLSLDFYGEGFGDVVIIGQTGQGFYNGVPGRFDITELVKAGQRRRLAYLKRDPLNRVTVRNDTDRPWSVCDQNGFVQTRVDPKSRTRADIWNCKLIISGDTGSPELCFDPYERERAFVMGNRKVVARWHPAPPEASLYAPSSLDLQIL